MSVVRRVSSVVRGQQLLQRTSPPKYLGGLLPNVAGITDPYMALLMIAQMVMVYCISRSHMLKIDF